MVPSYSYSCSLRCFSLSYSRDVNELERVATRLFAFRCQPNKGILLHPEGNWQRVPFSRTDYPTGLYPDRVEQKQNLEVLIGASDPQKSLFFDVVALVNENLAEELRQTPLAWRASLSQVILLSSIVFVLCVTGFFLSPILLPFLAAVTAVFPVLIGKFLAAVTAVFPVLNLKL